MEIKPPPRLVTLDTQVFNSYNFHYNSKPFQTLVKLSQEEKIRLLLTSVTLNELRAHIIEGAKLASEAVKTGINNLDHTRSKPPKGKEKIKISKNSDLLYEFKKKVQELVPNFEQIKHELLDKLEIFLQETDFQKIEVDQVSVVDIFENYFSGNPPFGEGKKKSEFPDAFALLALKKEAKDRNKIIYVVSGDSDWEKFCSSSEDLCWIGNLDELLENIIRETDSDEVDVCYELYRDKENEIERYIEDKFSDLDFSIDLSGSSLIEWGSEEIEVNVNSVHIINSSLVEIDDSDLDQPSVVFELEAEVNYDANVSYESLEYAIYDREDGMYYGGETIDTVFTQSVKLNVEVMLTLSRDKDYSLCDADVEDITIDPNNTLGEIVIDTGFKDDYY
ncbi:PIN domain-containing protein [Okeanomitos corallinicola TIOX110]|uniref:PIN domain-containing protein n=1 Tax=Okeanomitos corallinicola TIOX110 TaxID=3133117 RepID=A0ABZ2UQL3_9CYAN